MGFPSIFTTWLTIRLMGTDHSRETQLQVDSELMVNVVDFGVL